MGLYLLRVLCVSREKTICSRVLLRSCLPAPPLRAAPPTSERRPLAVELRSTPPRRNRDLPSSDRDSCTPRPARAAEPEGELREVNV
jgi:5-methylcytosine-specific restriction endonuclease McrA